MLSHQGLAAQVVPGQTLALRGALFSLLDNADASDPTIQTFLDPAGRPRGLLFIPDGIVFVRDGLIAWVKSAEEAIADIPADCPVHRYQDRLILPGFVDTHTHFPQLEVIVDYRRAALYGLQPSAVTEQLERLSNGRIVSRVVDGNRRFDVVLRLQDERRTTQGLGDLLIESPAGWIPVRQIADVVETDGPNQILR